MRASRRLVLLAAAAAPTAALMCAAPTEIVVDVYTDVPCTAKPQPGIATARDLSELSAKAGAPSSVATGCANDPQRLGRVVLRPGSDKSAPLALQVATRTNGSAPEGCTPQSADCIVARRQLSFARGESIEIAVHLRQSCLGVRCGDRETCVGGACVSAEVSSSCRDRVCDESELPRSDSGVPEGGALVADGGAGDAAKESGIDGAAPPVAVNVHDAGGSTVTGLSIDTDAITWAETVAPALAVLRRAKRNAFGQSTVLPAGYALPGPVTTTPDGKVTFAAASSPCQQEVLTFSEDAGRKCIPPLFPLGLAATADELFVTRRSGSDVRRYAVTDAGGAVPLCSNNNPVGSLTYAKLGANALYVGHTGGWLKVVGEACEFKPIPGRTGACRSVAATGTANSGVIVCCATSNALGPKADTIACFYESGPSATLELSAPGVEDLAFALEDIGLGMRPYLYYSAPPGIWRVPIELATSN